MLACKYVTKYCCIFLYSKHFCDSCCLTVQFIHALVTIGIPVIVTVLSILAIISVAVTVSKYSCISYYRHSCDSYCTKYSCDK